MQTRAVRPIDSVDAAVRRRGRAWILRPGGRKPYGCRMDKGSTCGVGFAPNASRYRVKTKAPKNACEHSAIRDLHVVGFCLSWKRSHITAKDASDVDVAAGFADGATTTEFELGFDPVDFRVFVDSGIQADSRDARYTSLLECPTEETSSRADAPPCTATFRSPFCTPSSKNSSRAWRWADRRVERVGGSENRAGPGIAAASDRPSAWSPERRRLRRLTPGRRSHLRRWGLYS